MVGYIGGRAKRKRRNIIIFFVFILIFIFGFYILPIFKVSEITPSDLLIPTDEEILSPKIIKTNEELELKIFDKDQKILFRNNQIKKLKEELKILVSENQKFSKLVSELSNEAILNSKKDKKNSDTKKEFNKIQKEYNSNILKLKNEISNDKKKYKDILNNNQKIIQELNSLKKEYKKYLSKNLKLSEIIKELTYKIELLEIKIKEKDLLIKVLEDVSHHG
jgi:hypothetical protein